MSSRKDTALNELSRSESRAQPNTSSPIRDDRLSFVAQNRYSPSPSQQHYSPYSSANARDQARRPLIEQVNNRWQDEKTSYSTVQEEYGSAFCDLEDDRSCPNLTKDAIVSKGFRRLLLILLLFVGLLFFSWSWFFKPQWKDNMEYKEGFLTSTNGTYGTAKGGGFDGVRLQEIDQKLMPGGDADPEGRRRLIFVGDIHGCATELKKLLMKVEFDAKTDHMIAVGDVISKGPENIEVLDELIRLKASSVRGNHEDRILAIAPSVLEAEYSAASAETTSKQYAKDSALLRQLSKEHLKYLRDMPLMLRIPPLPLVSDASHKDNSPLGEEIMVVHAGLVPAVPLEKQDPYFVMNMRAIVTKTHLPSVEAESKKDKSKPWHDIWCWYNDRLFKHKSLKGFQIWDDEESEGSSTSTSSKKYPDPQVVVYGHRSREGLQIKRWTKGLDTGCVKGGQLTALVLNAKGEQEIVQVDCEDHS